MQTWRPTARKASQGPSTPSKSNTGKPNTGKSKADKSSTGKSNAGRSVKATATSAVSGASIPAPDAPIGSSQSSAVQTKVLAAPADLGDCDYWIVSSRNCGGANAAADAGRCLLYLHRTSEQNLVREQRETFLASVRPDRPVCFVMHGSYNRWGDVMVESRKIHRWLRSAAPDSPLQVVFFTWPSDGNMPFIFPVDIAILGRRSAVHGAYLANLIAQLPADQQVAIVGHSHGARTAAAALHLLGGGALEEGPAFPAGSSYPRQVRAVLIAAAIDHNWLNPGQRYGQALLVPERVLLLRNSRDGTLAVYPMRKIMGERALGKDGLGQDDRFALGSLGPKVVELNAAEFADWHHSFADFHQRPELAKAMLPYVYFQEDGAAPKVGTPVITPTEVTPTGPKIIAPNDSPKDSPSDAPDSTTVRIVPAAKPPEARPDGDLSSPDRPTSEENLKKPAAPESPRNFIELELDP
ncbi:MAG TPA: alpha/beta hydrolase [Planctomycetaceae bacterium]